MTKEEFAKLQPGDIVKSIFDKHRYIVHANHGDRCTAVKIMDMTNPSEFVVVSKVKDRSIQVS